MLEHLLDKLAVGNTLGDGEVQRREFDSVAPGTWFPLTAEDRTRLESIVLEATPDRHRFFTAGGQQAIVYMDFRGRAASCELSKLPSEDLVRIARSHGKFPGDPAPGTPTTSATDHGYRAPVQEGKALDEAVSAIRDATKSNDQIAALLVVADRVLADKKLSEAIRGAVAIRSLGNRFRQPYSSIIDGLYEEVMERAAKTLNKEDCNRLSEAM